MKKVFFAVLILVFLLFFIVLIFGGGDSSKTKKPSNKTTIKTSSSTTTPGIKTVSDDVIYHQDNTPSAEVPFKTTYDPNYPGLSVYWVQQSASGGQDTCTLYDTATKQLYANRYIANSQYVSAESGTAYYTNTVIKQDKALSMLDSLCFIP